MKEEGEMEDKKEGGDEMKRTENQLVISVILNYVSVCIQFLVSK